METPTRLCWKWYAYIHTGHALAQLLQALTTRRLLQANEVLPIVQSTGVLAGGCGSDPFRSIPQFLGQLKALAFCGV